MCRPVATRMDIGYQTYDTGSETEFAVDLTYFGTPAAGDTTFCDGAAG